MYGLRGGGPLLGALLQRENLERDSVQKGKHANGDREDQEDYASKWATEKDTTCTGQDA